MAWQMVLPLSNVYVIGCIVCGGRQLTSQLADQLVCWPADPFSNFSGGAFSVARLGNMTNPQEGTRILCRFRFKSVDCHFNRGHHVAQVAVEP